MTRHFQFIAVPDPTERISPHSKRLAHSHVLRQRHRDERRSRTKAYQDRLQVRQSPSKAAEQSDSPFQSRMISYCKDPFSALIRPLSSQEYHLLDYCTCCMIPVRLPQCRLDRTFKVASFPRLTLLQMSALPCRTRSRIATS
jgi:hypothetical protein